VVEIALENLTKRYDTVTAVDDVTLTVPQGNLFFLLGPSGCGKTTLLRLIAGFAEADAGAIRFDGRRVDDVPAHLRNTGMVFQNYALWPHMDVYRNVRYGLDIRRLSRDRKDREVARMLSLVRMSGLEGRYPAELSGGQQQRVALARALVVEPAVVLLDEPLSNLDAKLRLEMRSEIKRIHRELGRTTVYVTHDQKEALSMADRVAVMNEGRIVQVGAPEEVYTRPVSLFCARFIGGSSTLPGAVREVANRTVRVETPLGLMSASEGPKKLSPGGRAVIAVRPELLRPASADAPNAFRARVVVRMYLGDMVQYQLRAGDLELTATVLGSDDWKASAGQDLTLAFGPGEAVAFPEESSDPA
jgi:iron(III) transport system ATP-binding protein